MSLAEKANNCRTICEVKRKVYLIQKDCEKSKTSFAFYGFKAGVRLCCLSFLSQLPPKNKLVFTRFKFMETDAMRGHGIQRKDTKTGPGQEKTDSPSQAARQDGEGERASDGDVTVNQHFPLLPPGPHVAHRHSRTWRGTV